MNILRSIHLRIRILLLAVLIISQAAYAQDPDGLNPTTSLAIQFESVVQFSVSIGEEVELSRAVLFLRNSPTSQFRAHIADLGVPEKTHASLSLDPRSLGLRPFALIEYYWQLDLIDGRSITTNTERATYADQKYVWQELSGDHITVHWVDGDLTWGQDLIAIADEALQDIQLLLAVPETTNLHLYIFPSQSALMNNLRQAGIDMASAHALPELGVALAAGKSDPETLIRFEQEIPHELVHLLLFERMGTRMDNLPVWLNEGLATLYEQSPRAIYSASLERAKDEHSLIDIQTLCASFPASEQGRILAYAQSVSFISYLIDIYGTGGILQLLDAYEEGTTCTGGIQRIYQRSLGQLQSEWEASILSEDMPAFTSLIPVLLVVGAGLIIITMAVYWLLRKGSKPPNQA